MPGLALRTRDSLTRKARGLAMRHGVSLDRFVTATVAATVGQEETLACFDDRLKSHDPGWASRIRDFLDDRVGTEAQKVLLKAAGHDRDVDDVESPNTSVGPEQ